MHSSRMRTGRSLTVCQCLLPGGGVCSWGCLLWEGVCSRGCLPLGGVCSGGVSAPRGCLLLGGVCSGGVSAPRGVWYPSMH